ncbi:hypothetical protein CR513_09959, partial [Mucuna pruriens]
MTILDRHGLCSLPTRMSLLRSAMYSTNEFKMKMILILLLAEVEVVNTTCYLYNKIYIRPILKKTPYELWKTWVILILNLIREYSLDTQQCPAYKVYNSRTFKVEEFIHVIFNDSKPDKELSKLIEPFVELNIKKFHIASKESLLDDEQKITRLRHS